MKVIKHRIKVHKRLILMQLMDQSRTEADRLGILEGHDCKNIQELIDLVRESDQEEY